MFSKVTSLSKSKGAVLTPKRLLIAVCPHVDSKVLFSGSFVHTQVTLEPPDVIVFEVVFS